MLYSIRTERKHRPIHDGSNYDGRRQDESASIDTLNRKTCFHKRSCACHPDWRGVNRHTNTSTHPQISANIMKEFVQKQYQRRQTNKNPVFFICIKLVFFCITFDAHIVQFFFYSLTVLLMSTMTSMPHSQYMLTI